jgi:hypothetical protein
VLQDHEAAILAMFHDISDDDDPQIASMEGT